jgi:hypothetical protein
MREGSEAEVLERRRLRALVRAAERLPMALDAQAELAAHPQWEVRAATAMSPYLDAGIHEVLLRDEDPHGRVRQALVECAPLSALHQEEVATGDDEDLRVALAKNPRLLAQFQPALMGLPDWALDSLAKNPALTIDLQDVLALDPDLLVRHALASNPSLNERAVAVLLADRSVDVLASLARNPALGAAHQVALLERTGGGVHQCLALNPSLIPEVLSVLRASSNPAVREALVRNPAAELDDSFEVAVLMEHERGREHVRKRGGELGVCAEDLDVLSEAWSGTLGELLATCAELS